MYSASVFLIVKNLSRINLSKIRRIIMERDKYNFYLPESYKSVSQLAANNVHASFRYAQASEKLANVQSVGGPRQIL